MPSTIISHVHPMQRFLSASCILLNLLSLTACGDRQAIPPRDGTAASSPALQMPPAQAIPAVLQNVITWVPDLDWSAPRQELFSDAIDSGTRSIPANTVMSICITAPALGIARVRESITGRLLQEGWAADLSFDADGINGTRWGYGAIQSDSVQFLVASELSTDCTAPDENSPPTVCRTHESKACFIDTGTIP